MGCGNVVTGAIPPHRFAPAWRVGVLDLLDRRAAEHEQSPSIRRSARRSHRPTHRSARGTESTPSHFDEGCSMHGESRIATSACPTMDSCDTSVLTPCRKSSIAVLSPRLCGNIKSRQWLRRRLAVPGTPYL